MALRTLALSLEFWVFPSPRFVSSYKCGTMVSIHSVGVGVGEHQTEDSFVCFGTKPTLRAYVWDFLQDQKKTRKGKVPEQWSERSDTQGEATVRERRLLKSAAEARSWDLWTQKPSQTVRADDTVFLCGNFIQIHAHDSHRMPEKCLLTLRANPSLCLFVLLSSTLCYICYICCIFVRHVKCPWQGWEKPLYCWMTMSWYKKLR